MGGGKVGELGVGSTRPAGSAMFSSIEKDE